MRVWIWGASSGVGAALATVYVKRGDAVFCLSRRSGLAVRSEPFDMDRSGETLSRHLRRLLIVEGLGLDGDERDHIRQHGYALGFRRYWQTTRDGAPELAIISSGIGAYVRADQWRDCSWRDVRGQRHAGISEIVQIDLIARQWIVNELLMAMRRRRSGKIVVIGSMMAKRGRGDHAAGVYASAMRGIEAFLDCESKSAARRGIALGCVRLGWTDTPMTAGIVEWKKRAIEKALGPMLSADEAAAAIAEYASAMTPGASIVEIGR